MKIFCLLFFFTASLLANEHLELGVGPLAVFGNHYRGSDEDKLWLFPLPYFSYRSDRLEADPSFIRGLIYNSERFSFKLSVVPGLKVESKQNHARQGMPDLDYTLEMGPMFIFKLWQNDKRNLALNLEWPVRETLAVKFWRAKHVGLFQIPYLNFIQTPKKNGKWYSEFSLGPMFASKGFHRYYYDVDPVYSSPARPAFRSEGGYSGLQSAWVLNLKLEKISLLNFLRLDFLDRAAFLNSPLVKKKTYFIGGLGLFWMFD